MNHLSEDELILHYYGEEGDTLRVELHLEECGECREVFAVLQGTLDALDALPVPDLPADYGAQVWSRIERRIPTVGGSWWIWPAPWRFAAAAACCAGLMAAAFFAGRFYPQSSAPRIASATDAQQSERVLLVAVGDYLDRSQMVLTELANADPDRTLDISYEQERARDLIPETRLYRQTAARIGDTGIAAVLDELDRALLDIAHSPQRLAPGQLTELQHRFENESLRFKIRVLGSNLRSQRSETGRKL